MITLMTGYASDTDPDMTVVGETPMSVMQRLSVAFASGDITIEEMWDELDSYLLSVGGYPPRRCD